MSGAISSTPKFKVKDNAVTHEWLATLVAKPVSLPSMGIFNCHIYRDIATNEAPNTSTEIN